MSSDQRRQNPQSDTPSLAEEIGVRLLHVLGLGGVNPAVLARRVTASALRNDCLGQAAKMAYSLLFAFFPFLIFLTSIPAFLPVPNLLEKLLVGAENVVPAAALDLVQRNLTDLLTNTRTGVLTLALVATVGAGTSAVGALIDSLNRAYGIKESRPFWKMQGTALLLMVGLTLFGLTAMLLLVLGSQIGSLLANEAGFGPTFHTVWTLLRWPTVVVVLMVAMAILYYVGPDLRQGWKWTTPGAIFAVIGWIVVSLGFSYYVKHFGRYNQLHGSLGAVIVLMTWMYLSGLLVIIGGEINAKIEHGSPHGRGPGERARGRPAGLDGD